MKSLICPLLMVLAAHTNAELAPPAVSTPVHSAKSMLGGLAGAADTQFGSLGYAAFGSDPAPTAWDEGVGVFERAGGKYLSVGFQRFNNALVMQGVNANGSIDTGYGVNGRIVYTAGMSLVEDSVLDPQGRVLVLGNVLNAALESDPVLCRFTINGQKDLSFNGTGCITLAPGLSNANDFATSMATDAAFIYVAGTTTIDEADTDFFVMKVRSSDGLIQSNFGTSGVRRIAFDLNQNGFDFDGATAIARGLGPDVAFVFVGGYARTINDRDVAIAKLNIFDGSLDTNFCPNTTVCPGSQVLAGKMHRTLVSSFGPNQDTVQALVPTANGGVYVIAKQNRGESASTIGLDRIRVDRIVGATGAADGVQRNTTTILNYLDVEDAKLDANANLLLAGSTASNSSGNLGQVIFVKRILPTLADDPTFADFLGSLGAVGLYVFNKQNDAQDTENRPAKFIFDAAGKIVISATRLWRRDVPANVFDYDNAVFRLRGTDPVVSEMIFKSGFEN